YTLSLHDALPIFEQGGGGFEDGRARGRGGRVPGWLRVHRVGQGALDGGGVGGLPLADALAAVGRVGDRDQRPRRLRPGHQRRGAPALRAGAGERGVDLAGERAQLLVVGEVHAHRIAPFNAVAAVQDRKSTRLNSSHVKISYAV